MKFFLPDLFAKRHTLKAKSGFTLIELLVVIGILTVLLAIVLIAINPSKQFAAANNTQRRSDVNATLNAIHQFAADNKGTLPTGIPTAPAAAVEICRQGSSVSAAQCPVGTADLCAAANAALVPTYLADLPVDPTSTYGFRDPTGCAAATGYRTGYTVVRTSLANGSRITVSATHSEVEGSNPAPTISVTR